jgi:hypothetical protein
MITFKKLPEIGLLEESGFPLIPRTPGSSRADSAAVSVCARADERWARPLPVVVRGASRAAFGVWNVVLLKGSHLLHYAKEHETRYEAAAQPHTFVDILKYDFSNIKSLIGKCVEFHAELEYVGRTNL